MLRPGRPAIVSTSLLALIILHAILPDPAPGQFARLEPSTSAPRPIGFLPGSAAPQAAAEARALKVPTPKNARTWLRSLTEEPHVAGTAADYRTALDVRDKLRSWGWQADLSEYEVLLNYPNPASVFCQLVRPEKVDFKVTEEAVGADKDSASGDAFPAFHGYGVSGNVAGQVVYANYGRPDDFAALERLGVDVKGRIVLVRYGELFRGLKVLNAQKRGAKGVLIYSDPGDDGYARGDVYPNGPFRPGSAIQRGSVQFLSLGPGDPSTPNGPSIKGAKRLPIDPLDGFTLKERDIPGDLGVLSVKSWEKETGLVRDSYFATIPSLPISYNTARPILETLAGPNVPTGWQGGLPITYHVGPGPAEVRFGITMDYKIRPVWNVVATIQGDVAPDQWVMIGNHRDAWVYGAVDPSSGTSATLEMARALGDAVKSGWKPKRTLVYASWDAEEYGLVGSTEWADEHRQEIDRKAVLMLNVDSAVSGNELDLDGVPSLRDFLLEAADAVTDVSSGQSLRSLWMSKKRSAWASSAPIDLDDLWEPMNPNGGKTSTSLHASLPRSRPFSPQLNPLGSGSDYTAFVDHLGVPAIDVGFAGRYGVYHSIYDNFFWMEKFGDPEFLTHATAARLYTLIVMRAAGADVIPMRFTPYAEALKEYLDEMRRMLIRKERGKGDGAEALPFEFAGLPRLVAAIKSFAERAEAVDKATATLTRQTSVPAAKLEAVNAALVRVERSFLIPEGLPGRRWFKHAIYAPGLTTGYASWPMPGVRQAIEQSDSGLLATQSQALALRIEAAAEALRNVARLADIEPVKLDPDADHPIKIDVEKPETATPEANKPR